MVIGDENIDANAFFGTYVDMQASRMGVWVNAADRFSWQAMGIMPYNALILPVDRGWPSVPLLDTEAKKPVYIRVKANSSSGDNYMVVEELGIL